MILGIGCDIVRVERVERAAKNERFLIRVYTEAERTYAVQCGRAGAASLAARFAGKEAVLKAFGTGLRGGTLHDVEILPDALGAPKVHLHGFFAARAAEMVGALPVDAGAAAICTRRAGVLNGLVEIAGRIEDSGANCTRFFEVVRAQKISPPAAPDTVLLVAQIDGSRPGALYNVLGEFARREVNLTRIESRPARTELGAYLFFFDLDAHSDAAEEAIAAVARRSIWLKELGRFPVHLARNE